MVKPLPFSIYIADAIRVTHFHLTYLFHVQKHRKNDNVKGITVNDKEFLASQYADDTTLILDGSEESLETCLSILKFYADTSGLHINMEKLE